MTTNYMKMNETNVMAENAMTPPASTQATTPNEPAIDPRLQRWINFCEQTAKEAVEQSNYEAQLIKNAEENKKAKAEKRMMAKLKKLKEEQMAVLFVEAEKKIKEADRMFESQEHPHYDSTTIRPPSIIEDMRARNDLRALEREQKAELLRQVMEKRAKEAGDDWPRMQEMSQDPRYDRIPKYYTGEKEMLAKAFSGAPTAMSKEIK
jgi:hypothetical protein